jgi:hypothetical protein
MFMFSNWNGHMRSKEFKHSLRGTHFHRFDEVGLKKAPVESLPSSCFSHISEGGFGIAGVAAIAIVILTAGERGEKRNTDRPVKIPDHDR